MDSSTGSRTRTLWLSGQHLITAIDVVMLLPFWMWMKTWTRPLTSSMPWEIRLPVPFPTRHLCLTSCEHFDHQDRIGEQKQQKDYKYELI